MKTICLPLCLLIWLMQPLQGLSQGIHFKLINWSPFLTSGTENCLSWGFGYEQNVGEHICLSLEYQKSYMNSENSTVVDEHYSYQDASFSGYSFSYYIGYSWSEVYYQSKYLFAGNDEVSAYLSSGIGIRSFNYLMQITYAYADPGYEDAATHITPGDYPEDLTLVPITFKFGTRGNLDGFYGDIYCGICFIPGADRLPVDPFFKGKVVEPNLRGTSFVFGLNIGFGWSD